jgi:hypothetical protein
MGVVWNGRRDDDDDDDDPISLVAHQNLISLTNPLHPFLFPHEAKAAIKYPILWTSCESISKLPDLVLVLRSHKNEAKQKQNVRRLASSYAPVAAPIHNAKRPRLDRHTGDSTYRPASDSLPPSCAASPRRELWHQPEGLEVAGRHPADHPPQL